MEYKTMINALGLVQCLTFVIMILPAVLIPIAISSSQWIVFGSSLSEWVEVSLIAAVMTYVTMDLRRKCSEQLITSGG